jgi:hypothetical protein
MADFKNTRLDTTGHFGLPVGTTEQRLSAAISHVRINSGKNLIENYTGTGWRTDSNWVVVHTPGQSASGAGYRKSPSFTPHVLIQAESVGANNTNTTRRQFVQINGTTVVNSDSPRSYRLTRLRKDSQGFWEFVSSNGYDVYGLTSAAESARTYLQSFNDGDLLILNTWDEPRNNFNFIGPTLRDRFGSKIYGYQDQWTSRDMHLLISIAGSKIPIFEEHRPSPQGGIEVSAWLP